MERWKSLITPIAALLAGFVFIVLVGNAFPPTPRVYAPVVATSTLQVVPNETNSPVSIADTATTTAPGVTAAPSSSAQPAKQPTPVAPKKVVKAAPVAAPAAIPVAPTPAPELLNASLDASASVLRGALVNIICYSPIGGGLHSISGSGVIIDPKGIILTNAHIAQYFLLTDRGVSCKVRSGSPATDHYAAALIYLPPVWITNNASVLTQVSPSGTGEYDFALLGITKSLTATPLPASFPSIPLAREPLPAGAPVVIGSYGAQFLDYSQIQFDLFPTLVSGSVKDVFTFKATTIDILALGGSAAAQEGSSGGGVADALSELSGTIVTSTMEGDTSTRQLNAITASYIRAEYASETGQPLDSLLATPVATAISDFSAPAADLEATLVAHLPQ